MAKARSKTSSLEIKRENAQDETKTSKLSNGISKKSTNGSNKSKKKTFKSNSTHLPSISDIKLEDSENKFLLQETLKSGEPQGKKNATEEQIEQLVDHTEKNRMTVTEASKKVNTSTSVESTHRNNPNRNDPVQEPQTAAQYGICTYEQVKALIGYIVEHGMTIKEASIKAKMCSTTATKYYNMYLADPNQQIPVPEKKNKGFRPRVTLDQIKALIHYIKNDKMNLLEASNKANMAAVTGKYYYSQFLIDPNHNIPTPRSVESTNGKSFTYNQVATLIKYIVDDKMTVVAAALKAKMTTKTAKKYYSRYLDDPNHEIPVSKPVTNSILRCTNEQIKALIDYIEKDKLPVSVASQKANMDHKTGKIYYYKYLNDPNKELPLKKFSVKPTVAYRHTQDQIKTMINYVVNDKMSILEASVKVGMSDSCARKYYKLYINDPNSTIPAPTKTTPRAARPTTYDQIKALIGYILDDKMTIVEASKKADLARNIGLKYYNRYLNDPDRKIPLPIIPARPTGQCCSHDQVKSLISYIVDDKMSIKSASEKAKMCPTTGRKYYYQYLDNPKQEVSVPEKSTTNIVCPKRHDQIKKLIGYIVDNKMTVGAASRKAGIPMTSSVKYYQRYLNDPEHKIPVPATPHKYPTQDQINDLIRYIVNDKFSVIKAGKLAGIPRNTAYRYYKQYINDPQRKIPLQYSRSNVEKPVKVQVKQEDIEYKNVDEITVQNNITKRNLRNRSSESNMVVCKKE